MRRLLPFLVVALVPGMVVAQPVPPPSVPHVLTLTDQQIDAIISAGAQCENRVAYACAEYVVYIRNWLNDARRPKTAPTPAPENPK